MADENRFRKLQWNIDKKTVLCSAPGGASQLEIIIAERLFTFLSLEMKFASEAEIMAAVTGKKINKVLVLRKLVECGIVNRCGEGRRKAPYRYCIDIDVALTLESKPGESKAVAESTEQKNVAIVKQSEPQSSQVRKVLEESASVHERSFEAHELKDFTEFFRLLHNIQLKKAASN